MIDSDRCRRDAGSSTLTTVLLTPVFLVVAMMAFQAAMWNHARAEARAVARESANQVARQGASPEQSERSAQTALSSNADLVDVDVTVSSAAGWVTVRIVATAPGLISGTRTGVEVVEAVPLEGWRP